MIFIYFLNNAISLKAQDQKIVDSLKNSLETAVEDTSKVNAYLGLAKELRESSPDTALSYANRALKLSEISNYEKGEALGYYLLGATSILAQKFQQSIAYNKEALRRLIELKDERKTADCLTNIGSAYLYLGDFSNSIEYILKSISLYESIGVSDILATCYNNIAIAYFESQNEEKAEEFLKKALALHEVAEDYNGLFTSYLGLGNVNEGKKNYKKALEYFQQCALIAEKLNNDGMRSLAYGSLSLNYNNHGNYADAIKTNQKAIEIQRKQNNYFDLSSSFVNRSNSYIGLEKWDKALSALDSAAKYSSPETYLASAEMILNNYSVVYEHQGKYKKALESKKEYVIIRDSVHTKENTDKINELTIQFETERKEKEIVQLEAERKANELELIKKDRERNTIMGIGALLLLSLVFSYFFWRQKQISNLKTIALNKERIDSLLNENKINYANAMIEGQEAERKRLAEDLHDRLGSILSTMKLHLNSPKDGSIEKANSLLDESVDEVRKISHNLASISLVRFGLIASLKSLSESIVSDDLKVSFIHHGIDERLPSKIAIALYRCAQELINNVLKHSNASKLTIQIQRNGGYINLIIEDNGKGFDTTKGVTGIGLKNIRSRVSSIDGQINFDSLLEKGTTVIIDIPLKS